MSIWERITSTTEARGIGSMLGRLAGLFGGASADTETGTGAADVVGGAVSHHQVAFTIAVIALGAKMAKADGQVTSDEVSAFKEVFRVAPKDMANVARVFDLARQDVAGYEVYADQLAHTYKGNPRLLQDVLEGLFHIASADGVLHPDEDRFLADVARRFGFTDSQFRYFRSRFAVTDDGSPYDVLKIGPEATNDELKAQYRRLVAGNHPDSYIARGMPQEAIDIANRKLAAINAAYEVIAKERGMK